MENQKVVQLENNQKSQEELFREIFLIIEDISNRTVKNSNKLDVLNSKLENINDYMADINSTLKRMAGDK